MTAVRVRWSNLLLLATLLALPAALAPHLAGWHWTLDLTACFAVQTMGWLMLAACLLAAAKRYRAAAVALAGGVVAGSAVVPDWLRGQPTGNGVAVRAMTLNLLRENHAAAAAALATVRENDPDVLFCSEVTPQWLEALTPGLAHLPHRCLRADPGWFGVALFSRWPLRSAEVIPLAFEWAPAVRAVVASPAGPLGVLGLHTPRPGTGPRCTERDRALAAVPTAIAPLPPMHLVLGDANATPWNHAFRSLLAATGLQDARGGGWLPTWPSMLPACLRLPIDHVLVSDGIGVATCTVGADFGSDHLPLIVELRLPQR